MTLDKDPQRRIQIRKNLSFIKIKRDKPKTLIQKSKRYYLEIWIKYKEVNY